MIGLFGEAVCHAIKINVIRCGGYPATIGTLTVTGFKHKIDISDKPAAPDGEGATFCLLLVLLTIHAPQVQVVMLGGFHEAADKRLLRERLSNGITAFILRSKLQFQKLKQLSAFRSVIQKCPFGD